MFCASLLCERFDATTGGDVGYNIGRDRTPMLQHLRDILLFRPPETTLEVPGAGTVTLALHSAGDPWISGVIQRGEMFDAHILGVLRELLAPNSVFVDIGANIGWFTVIGSRLVGKGGRVFAIEPDHNNLRLLHRNIKSNECRNVTVFPVAAGDAVRSAYLFRSAENQGDHRLEINSTRFDRLKVRVRPVDVLLIDKVKQIDMVKIDTQGSESTILRGMREVLMEYPKLRVILEFWPYGLLKCGSSVSELATLLNMPRRILWLLMADGTATETTPNNLCELAKDRFAPETKAHADLVWMAEDDKQGLVAMKRRAE
jgi:FkbM family methyltransferase